MFTLVGYSGKITEQSILTYLPALADQHVRVEGNNIVVPEGMDNLLAVWGCGTNISGCQIEAPSLRRTLLLDVIPLNVGDLPASGMRWHEGFSNPLPLDAFEPIRALAMKGIVDPQRETVFLWLGDGAQEAVGGEIYTVKCTGSTTLTAYEWTNCALTITQTLPAGRYQVVGMRASSAHGLAARLVFVGGTWRPGVICARLTNDIGSPLFRRGKLGIWGEFSHDQPPTVDFLATSADAAETVWLDLIKVA